MRSGVMPGLGAGRGMPMSMAEIHTDLGASLGPHDELIRISILMGERGLGIGLDEDMQVGWPCESARCCHPLTTISSSCR